MSIQHTPTGPEIAEKIIARMEENGGNLEPPVQSKHDRLWELRSLEVPALKLQEGFEKVGLRSQARMMELVRFGLREAIEEVEGQ